MTNGAYTYDDGAVREDLLDIISNLSPRETQMCTGFGVSEAQQPLHQWLVDELDAVGDNAHAEGVDASIEATNDPARLTNVTQIFKKHGKVSDTERDTDQAGFNDRYEYEVTKKLAALKNDKEYAVVRGCLNGSVVSNNATRRMRGVKMSLSLITAQSGVSLTEAILNDYFQLVWENTNTTVNEVYGSMYMKRKISGFTGGAEKQVDVEDKRLVGVVEYYVADAAPMVKLFAHRYVTISGDTNYDLIGLDVEKFKLAYLRKPKVTELAKTGDNTKFQIVSEMTLEVLHPNAGFWAKSHL